MAAPVASFKFNANGLSVIFTDGSSGVVTSYNWDFGHKDVGDNQVIATGIGPHTIVFPSIGIYKVTLVASNGDGSSSYTFNIVLSSEPTLNLTIFDMVRVETPPGIAVDGVAFENFRKKWQLYLHEGLGISTANVFKEELWPPLANVLIAKLIIYDLVLDAAKGAMIIFSNASQSFNQLSAQITSGSILVADYNVDLAVGFAYPVVVNMIIINGISYGPSASLANDEALINYLNGLQKGIFIKDANSIKSLGNANIITTFNYTHAGGGVNSGFTQSNARIVNVAQQTSSGSTTGGKGPIKKMEVGPSSVEWYDSSEFWSNMFKAGSSGRGLINGQSGGVLGQIQMDACIYASHLRIKLPFCSGLKVPGPFSVVKKY